MKQFCIYWVGWNSAHPHRQFLGRVWAKCESQARLKAYREWPCGNGQLYEATAA